MDVVGSTTQVSLDELRSRRERSNHSMNSPRSPRSESDLDGTHSDEDETRYSARERIKERAKRSIPRRTKSADEDLMTMRTSSRDLLGSPRQSVDDSVDEREARRLERLNRSSETTSQDLSTRLEERRKARAAEREAREREKRRRREIHLNRTPM